MTFADAAVGLALTARLDMAIPSLKAALVLYAGNRGFVTAIYAFQTYAQRARRSRKGEPDCPGSPCAFAVRDRSGLWCYDGIRTVSTTWITPFD